MINNGNNLGSLIKQRRLMAELTLQKLSLMSGISASALGRIEQGERFPSATILRKIAKPLDLSESELFIFAGYLSPQPSNTVDSFSSRRLDPYVADLLSQEPLEVQRIVLTILSILKSLTKSTTQQNSRVSTKRDTGM
jgi:transcriptional regulator with XRE-family HTH domain